MSTNRENKNSQDLSQHYEMAKRIINNWPEWKQRAIEANRTSSDSNHLIKKTKEI